MKEIIKDNSIEEMKRGLRNFIEKPDKVLETKAGISGQVILLLETVGTGFGLPGVGALIGIFLSFIYGGEDVK